MLTSLTMCPASALFLLMLCRTRFCPKSFGKRAALLVIPIHGLFLLNAGCKSNNYIFGNKVGPTESCWIIWRCLLDTEEVLWILLDSLPLSGVLGKLFSDYSAFLLWSELFKLIFHNTFRSKIGLWRTPEFLQWDLVSHHSWVCGWPFLQSKPLWVILTGLRNCAQAIRRVVI